MADIRINSLPSTATSFNTDDYIAIDGASGGTRKMLAATLPLTDVTLGGSSGPSVKSSLSARAPRQGLVFDGTAGNFGSATIPSPGTAKSVHLIVGVPSANPSANQALLVIGNDSSFVSTQWISLRTTGELWFETTNSGGSDAARIVVSGFVSANAGKTVSVVFTLDGSSTATAYVNGVVASTNSDADWATSVSGTQLKLGGSSQFAEFSGAILSPLIYNRALSASEVVALYEAGAPAGADYNSASNTAINTSAFTNYNTTSFTGVSATGFTAVSSAACEIDSNPNFSLAVGQRIRATFSITVNSGTVYGVLAEQGVGAKSAASVTFSTGTYSIELVATGASSNAAFIFSSTGASNFVVSNFSAVRAGLLLAPDAAQAGGGLVWYDTSGNAANITLPASGVSWNVPSSRVLGGNWTTSGNLTVSGTGLSSVAGAMKVGGTAAFTGAGLELQYVAGGGNYGYFRNYNRTSSVYERLYVDGFLTILNSDSGGNVLIGTTTDGGQKLQVAGGIAATGLVDITGPDNSGANGVGNLKVYAANRTALLTFNYQNINASGALLLSTAGTTALTLDSSQNATFAGKLYSVSGTATTPAFSFTGDTGTGMYRSSAGIGALAASGSTAAFWANNVFAIYSGVPLRLGNAYTAGAPTATGYVTIQDSAGNTYKVLVGT